MNKNTFILKFDKPLTLGRETKEKEYKELIFDYDSLTGTDAVAAEQEMTLKTELADIKEYSPTYLGKIAARAAKVDSIVIESLPIRYYNTVTRKTQLFLLGMNLLEGSLEDGQEVKA